MYLEQAQEGNRRVRLEMTNKKQKYVKVLKNVNKS